MSSFCHALSPADVSAQRLVFTPTQDTAEGALAGPAPAGPDGWRPAFHVVCPHRPDLRFDEANVYGHMP